MIYQIFFLEKQSIIGKLGRYLKNLKSTRNITFHISQLWKFPKLGHQMSPKFVLQSLQEKVAMYFSLDHLTLLQGSNVVRHYVRFCRCRSSLIFSLKRQMASIVMNLSHLSHCLKYSVHLFESRREQFQAFLQLKLKKHIWFSCTL